ncbi:MAG: Ig-like domain repeat protein [Acidobacteria bacterium]|nr:Ig-like domain repeat protein [Acidobacteriota bacterium]
MTSPFGLLVRVAFSAALSLVLSGPPAWGRTHSAEMPVAPEPRGSAPRENPPAMKERTPRPNAILTVTNLADSGAGSLRQAIADALPNDTITFSVTGVIELNSSLTVNKALTISGPGPSNLTIRRNIAAGTPAFSVFEIVTASLVRIWDVTIANGSSDWGGGIDMVNVPNQVMEVERCHFTGNQATLGGGAISSSFGTLTVRDSTFSGNSVAPSTGAGAILAQDGSLTVINSTFTGNWPIAISSAAYTAGYAASATITNSTFARNGPQVGWGAIAVTRGGASAAPPDFRMRNTLIADHPVRNFSVAGVGAAVTSDGHNLDTDGTSGLVNGVNGDIAGTLANKLNARVGNLQNLGGPVPTMPLKFGSPALDAGDDTVTGAPLNLTLDARGLARNSDGTGDGVAHVDIGALESQPCVVTTTADSGAGSLRQCILDNEAWGGGLVRFNIAGAGLQTITPLSSMPAITRPLTVDGYTQPGSSPNTLAVGNNAVFGIQISGASFPNASVFALNGSDSTVRGFVINGFTGGQGSSMGGTASTDNWVQGNFFGTNAAGTAAVANLRGTYVAFGAKRNIVGTDSDGVNDYGERNLLSGNINEGIFLQNAGTDSNIVAGNYIGTNAQGTAAIPNTFAGVNILTNATNNTIGGTTAAARNVISGNSTTAGVVLQTAGSTGNRIIGNYIGVNAAGTGPLPNRWGFYSFYGPQITVGGPSAPESNLIAFNTEQGVLLQGSVSNTVRRNSIHSNGTLGIELTAGANGGITPPVLTSIASSTIAGNLAGVNGETYRVEFFANTACDPTRRGEGEVYLGSVNAVPASGTATFSFPYTPDVARPYITATSTRVSTGDTSAFSGCIPYATSTGVTSSLNPSTYGGMVTFTATVTNLLAGGPVPSGSVQFVIDGNPVATVPTAGGVAATSLNTLIPGNHTVVANFTSASDFAASSGSLAGGQNVNTAPLTITANNASRPFGSANPPFSAVFTGLVLSDIESEVSGAGFNITTPATPASPVGPYPIIPAGANGPKAPYYTITYQNGTLLVGQGQSTTTLVVSPSPSCYGQPVTLTATVTPVAPSVLTPTGSVQFYVNGVPQLTGTLFNGVATANAYGLNLGTTNFSAQYIESPAYTTSTSAVVAHLVKPTPETTITAPSAICASSAGSAAVPLNPAATYSWTISGGTFTSSTTGSSVAFTAGASGTVTLWVTAVLDGCPSSSSKTITIQQLPATPVASLPANGATGYTLGFVAFTSAGDAEHDVYFDTVNPPQKLLVTGLTDNFDVPIPVWFSNTTYYWKVVARNACGSSAVSPVYTFTTGTCPWSGSAPALVSPVDAVRGLPRGVELKWNLVPGAAHYDILIGTSPANLLRYASMGTPKTSLVVDLAPGKSYYWRVDAFPGCSTSAAVSSSTWSFSTAGGAMSLGSVTPAFLNRWESGEVILSGAGFLATDSLFITMDDENAGSIVAPPFTNSFSNATQLAGTLTPSGSAPAGRYDTGVVEGQIEEGRLLQSLALRAFTDVTEADWYFESSARITEAGIMEGDADPVTPNPQFSPNSLVTRAMMAQYLAAAYQWWRTRSTSLPAATCTPSGAGSTTFPDVPCSHPQWLSIHWLKQWGVTSGSPCALGTCYLPGNTVNRGEMVTFLERLKQSALLPTLLATVGTTDPGCSQPLNACSGWTDASLQADAWPRREVNVAFADRLTKGCAGTPGSGLTFCTLDPVTRAQIGEFLARILGLVPMP